jgi:hypothetical protein
MKVSVVYPFLGTSSVRRFVVTCVKTTCPVAPSQLSMGIVFRLGYNSRVVKHIGMSFLNVLI